MGNVFKNISASMIERYSERYNKLGFDVKTLGWGDKEQQVMRFYQTIDTNLLFDDKSIVDIGCGFGDYYDFIKNQNIGIREYTGLDVNSDLIDEARTQHKNDSKCSFNTEDILNDNPGVAFADIGVMLGVLNLNLSEQVDNYFYSKKVIQNAFSKVRDCLIVDFISSKITGDYPMEDFIFYHDPQVMLDFALSISPNVVIKHDYPPIPQKEFMLFIYK